MTTLTVKVWVDDNGNICRTEIPEAELYKRPWVGLTEEEITQLDMDTSGTVHDFMQAVEQFLKGKNT